MSEVPSRESVDREAATHLDRIGKGVVQINLRLSRALELLESGAGSAAKTPNDSGTGALPALFDLIDAVEAALHAGELASERAARSNWLARWFQRDATNRGVADSAQRGLRIAHAQVLERLRISGVSPVAAQGKFDAALHTVIERVATPDSARDGMVARTHQSGWVRESSGQSTVLRHALVSVYARNEES